VQACQQELSTRMEQMRRLTVQQESKYAAMGRELPQEMQQHLAEMNSLEKEVRIWPCLDFFLIIISINGSVLEMVRFYIGICITLCHKSKPLKNILVCCINI
jgi:hypothetical protein